MYKYPRTPHIEGSRLQPGDEDLDSVPFSAIASQYVVVGEKVFVNILGQSNQRFDSSYVSHTRFGRLEALIGLS